MFNFADFRFKSLDDIFYFGGQSEHQQEAIYKHKPAKHNQVWIPFLAFLKIVFRIRIPCELGG
jgi:hypothetical protein